MIVYLITNLINEKYYVGWSSTDFISRWNLHIEVAKSGANYHLSRAIRKYGPENFSYQILALVLTRGEAKNLEKVWIQLLKANHPEIGYNMTSGGDGWHGYDSYSEEDKIALIEKRRNSLIERWKNPTQKQLQCFIKISQKLKGRSGRTDVKKGKSYTEYYGLEKAKIISKKLSEINSGMKKGVWVTDGTKNKVVDITKIPEGWRRGKTQRKYVRNAPVSFQTIQKMRVSQKLRWDRIRKISPAPVTGVLNKSKK